MLYNGLIFNQRRNNESEILLVLAHITALYVTFTDQHIPYKALDSGVQAGSYRPRSPTLTVFQIALALSEKKE